MPLAAHATWSQEEPGQIGGILEISAIWGELETTDGSGQPRELIRAKLARPVSGFDAADELGETVARLLIGAGAKSLRGAS